MEWSLHIKGASDLEGDLGLERLAALETSALLRPFPELAARLIRDHFGAVRFTRCAFGNEFCEHLLPSPDPLAAALAAARSRGMAFTLLTPYVSDRGIDELRRLLGAFDEDGGEVVFNDWGTLNLLRREFPHLVPVQGRLLNKSLRDPRVTTIYASAPAPAATLGAL